MILPPTPSASNPVAVDAHTKICLLYTSRCV